jgi:hypothetical protein
MPIISHIVRVRRGKMGAGIDMNARSISPANAPPAPRFDRKFIDDHNLLERYLDGKLPFKGARDLENWCRAHPEYLSEHKLSERAQSSLKLLEASGQPIDLREPTPPWWKSTYVLIGLACVTFLTLAVFWLLFIKYELLQSRLEDTRRRIDQGPLVQPATERSVHIAPDQQPGMDRARIVVNRSAPELLDVHVDMAYTNKLNQFQMLVDKKDQGRALILNNILKDSNNELRFTLNSSGLAAGIYTARIEALPIRGTQGSPIPIAWLILEVR